MPKEYEKYWNFPNCVGTIDGKHVTIQCPAREGSLYFFHSIVLRAVINARYEFSMVDIGGYGRLIVSTVYTNSNLGRAINQNPLQLPSAIKMANKVSKKYTYVFVGDETFPLLCNLLKPFSRNALESPYLIFNYRLSRTRCIVDNAFEITTSSFRVFRRSICAEV